MNNCKHCGYPLSEHGGGRIGFRGCEEFEEKDALQVKEGEGQ